MKPANTPEIKYLFEPRTVAVIGASHNKQKIGHQIIANILAGKFPGKVYPVNPQGGKILGLKVYKDIEEIPQSIDLAVMSIPAKYVLEAVKKCPDKNAKFIAIISSGFSEIGNLEQENEIAAFSRKHGMRVLGPNIFGIYSRAAAINATFGPKDIMPGKVAIITQSGALGIAMIGKTAAESIGLSAMVSVGNKSDLDEADLMEYLIEQPGTKIIMMYIEGVKEGERFLKTVKAASSKKPVIVVKSGRSRRGAIAAASHTGSLAGADNVFDAVIRQCGALRAESLEEAFNWVKFLAEAPAARGENTVIVTNGGGIGVLATDACEKYGITLYDDLKELNQIFKKVMPEYGSTKNPVDLTGGATSKTYDYALDAALKDENIDSVIALYCQTAMFDGGNLPQMIESNYLKYQKRRKPLVFSIFGGKAVEDAIAALRQKGVPVFPDVYQAASCLAAMYGHIRYLAELSDETDDAQINVDAVNAIVDATKEENRFFLLANEAQQIMKIAGIPIPKSVIAHSLNQAVKSAEQIGYPVVMKVVSRDVVHKSDVGGVALDLLNRNEVISAYEAVLHNVRAHQPEAEIEGVEVAEMVKPGIETIIGARRDKVFGPLIMFGAGGKYVEVFKDVTFRALPLNRKEIRSMLQGIRSYPLLVGVRGEKQKDIDAIIDTIIKLGSIIQKCKAISDIEINPLVVYENGQGARAIDVRILLSNP